MTERYDTDLEMSSGMFQEFLCPSCGADLTEDSSGLRMRIGVYGVANLTAVLVGETVIGYELDYSYSEDDKREEYLCYDCDTVVISIVRD